MKLGISPKPAGFSAFPGNHFTSGNGPTKNSENKGWLLKTWCLHRIFKKPDGSKTKRFQCPAIDDATRIRALKIYEKHTQQHAIYFIDYGIEKFPFCIQSVRTDNGHEFQSKFHWHVAVLGMRHAYIQPRTPRLNEKVKRSHKTDQQEFYQLFEYSGDVDLGEKLKTWENFYNFDRLHGAFSGKTPYAILKEKMKL